MESVGRAEARAREERERRKEQLGEERREKERRAEERRRGKEERERSRRSKVLRRSKAKEERGERIRQQKENTAEQVKEGRETQYFVHGNILRRVYLRLLKRALILISQFLYKLYHTQILKLFIP